MGFPNLPLVQTPDRLTNQLQQNIRQTFNALVIPVMTEWTTFPSVLANDSGGTVATGTGTNACSTSTWRRVGDTMEMSFNWGWGTADTSFGTASGEFVINLPLVDGFQLTADTTKSATSIGSYPIMGTGNVFPAGVTTTFFMVEMRTTGKLYMRLSGGNTVANNGTYGVNQTTIAAFVRVPISTWTVTNG